MTILDLSYPQKADLIELKKWCYEKALETACNKLEVMGEVREGKTLATAKILYDWLLDNKPQEQSK